MLLIRRACGARLATLSVIAGLACAVMFAGIEDNFNGWGGTTRDTAVQDLTPPPPVAGTLVGLPTLDSFGRSIRPGKSVVVSLASCNSCAIYQVIIPSKAHFRIPVILVYPNSVEDARAHLPVRNRSYLIVCDALKGVLPTVMHAWASQAIELDTDSKVVRGASGPRAVSEFLRGFEK